MKTLVNTLDGNNRLCNVVAPWYGSEVTKSHCGRVRSSADECGRDLEVGGCIGSGPWLT